MQHIYDHTYLLDTVDLIEDALDDFESWNLSNDGVYDREYMTLKMALLDLKRKL